MLTYCFAHSTITAAFIAMVTAFLPLNMRIVTDLFTLDKADYKALPKHFMCNSSKIHNTIHYFALGHQDIALAATKNGAVLST